MYYVGPLYVRPIGRGVVLTGLKDEPHLDDVLPDGDYFAEIRVYRWPLKKEDVPAEVLKAGISLFTDFESLALWLNQPSRWTKDGMTSAELIKCGKASDVVGALKGLATGNFL